MDSDGRSRSNALVWIGAAIVAAGAIALLTSTGVIPIWLLGWWDRFRFPLSLIVIGIAVIVLARSGVHRPAPGSRLFRARDDRWVAGVLAGLGRYFGIDPTVLRLVFIALLVAGTGWIVFAYLVMAVVVPTEPEAPTGGQDTTQPPASPEGGGGEDS